MLNIEYLKLRHQARCPDKPEVYQIGMQTRACMAWPAQKYGKIVP